MTTAEIATLAPAPLPQTLVPVVLGGGLRVGRTVFAVGHPLGPTDSLSAGVVSALDRFTGSPPYDLPVTLSGSLPFERVGT